jgi:hypothetical protein
MCGGRSWQGSGRAGGGGRSAAFGPNNPIRYRREICRRLETVLCAQDKDIYSGWYDRKFKNKKSDHEKGKQRERDYAVKVAKKERAQKLVTEATNLAVSKLASPTLEAAIEVAKAEAEKALAEDLTKTLKPFTKKELEGIAKSALKKAKADL